MALFLFASPPAFWPLPVLIPPPPVPLVGEVLFPTVVPIVPLDVAPATAAFAVSGGLSEPESAKLADTGARTKIEATARARNLRIRNMFHSEMGRSPEQRSGL